MNFGFVWGPGSRPQPADLAALGAEAQVGWVDLSEVTDGEAALMVETLGIHPLIVAACVAGEQGRPKVERFGEFMFLALRGIDYTPDSHDLHTALMYLIVGRRFVVTVHRSTFHAIASVRAALESGDHDVLSSPSMIAQSIAEALVENIDPAIELMADSLDTVEEEAIRDPGQETLESLLRFKRTAQQLQRYIRPQRDVIARLARGDFQFVDEETRHHFQRTYEKVAIHDDTLDAIRERTESALSMYLSAVANRQNELMRVLSIVAAIFLPLGLLAGVYGMNFTYMPELDFRYGYYVVLGLIIVVSVSIFWWLWGARLVHRGRRKVVELTPEMVKPRRLLGVPGAAQRTMVRYTRLGRRRVPR